MNKKARELVAQMTLEEKASLCSGQNFWETKAIKRLGIPRVMLTDGPHGLRKQLAAADHLGIAESVPATCFPAACATGCSFDKPLLAEMGRAIGAEAVQENVAVVLGPGVNIKRSPLGGRNFEYFSEDPLISGELAAALINGVQEQGVGTSLKHFVANDQETRRMTINSVVDMRTLREIYLKAFEIPVRKSQPWTVMCAYNLVNGVYASDDKWLNTTVLRDEWGFEGLVVTDWGAMNDRVAAVVAGLDLEMPAGNGSNDIKIIEAVKNGSLKETDLDKVVTRVVKMVLKSQETKSKKYDMEAHHKLARKIAAESCVLLKNDGILPLKKGAKLAIIGEMAKKPRYQGAGSSKINPSKMDNAFDELAALGFAASFALGYNGVKADNALIDEAVKTAAEADIALVFAGLPDAYESEGFDRSSLAMPESHTQLIQAVSKANSNTIVVLQLGSPVLTDWAKDIKGLLVAYLGGQAGGGGIADVLAGVVNPSGKLAESWPIKLEDNPSYNSFPGGRKTVEYRESIFVGYRYYDTISKEVAWPFGFGLSYTSFEYSGLAVKDDTITFTITNTGSASGAEAAQVYLGLDNSKIFRPKKWLAAFEKVKLNPGEIQEISIPLEKDAFKYYNTAANGWRVEAGTYTIYVGASVKDIRLTETMEVQGDGDEELLSGQKGLGYFNLKGNVFSEADFTALYGKPLPQSERQPGELYTVNSTLNDIQHTSIGQRLKKEITQRAAEKLENAAGDDIKHMVDVMIGDMPLRAIGMMGGDSLPPNFPDMVVATLNGGFFARTAALFRLVRAIGKGAKHR